MEKILCNNPWEGLCFMMNKALIREKLDLPVMKSFKDDPKFFKKYEVRTCPVLLVLDKGKVVDRIKGIQEIINHLKEDVQT